MTTTTTTTRRVAVCISGFWSVAGGQRAACNAVANIIEMLERDHGAVVIWNRGDDYGWVEMSDPAPAHDLCAAVNAGGPHRYGLVVEARVEAAAV